MQPRGSIVTAVSRLLVSESICDVLRAGKGSVDGLGIAHAHREGSIAGGAVMDQWRSSADRVLGAYY